MKTVVVLKHTLRPQRHSRFTLTSLWVVFSLTMLYFKLNFWPFSVSPCSCRLNDTCSIKGKRDKNDYHLPLREDKPSLSSLVTYSSQLSPSRYAFALLFLHETSMQHARKYYLRESWYVPKLTLEGLRWVEGLYGGLILWAPSSFSWSNFILSLD